MELPQISSASRIIHGSHTINVVFYLIVSFFAAFLIYFIGSINLIAGYSFLLIFTVLLTFSRYKIALVGFYCWVVFFQNALIAYTSGFVAQQLTFDVLHGTNFLITIILFGVTCIRRLKTRLRSKLFYWTLAALLILLVYTSFGFFFFGMKNSVAYLRLFSMIFMMFWIGQYFATIVPEYDFRIILKTIFFLTLISILGQFLFPRLWISLMNDVSYYSLKVGANSYEEVVNQLYSNTYFNLPSFGKGMRAPGFIKSFISSAYFIICLAIALFWKEKPSYVLFTFLVMVACVASKGAFLCFIFFVILFYSTKKFNLNLLTALFLLLFLWVPIVIYGYYTYNEHLIGFVSGTGYILSLGNGLGFSGNLSDTMLTSFNGPPLLELGYWTRFYNGSESALGVLFSSLGIFSILYLFYLIKLLLSTYSGLKKVNNDYLAILSIVMLFQGIFQEEAFSPYAFGLVIFITGYYTPIKANNDTIRKI